MKFNKNDLTQWFYLISGFIAKVGNRSYLLAMPLLIFELTGSSFWMGTMFLVETLPILFFGPIAGFTSDRYNRRRIMLLANISQLLILLFIWYLGFNNIENIYVYLLCGFLLSIVGIFYSIANESLIPLLVSKEKIVNFNARYQLFDTLAIIIGPSFAALMISLYGLEVTLLVNAMLLIPSITWLIFNKVIHIRQLRNLKFFSGTMEGISYVKNNPLLRKILILSIIANVCHGIISALLIFYLLETHDLSSFILGAIFSIVGVGQLIITLFISKIKSILGYGQSIIYAQVLVGLGIILVGISGNWFLVLIGKLLTDMPTLVYNTLSRSIRHEIVPDEMMGRVNGVYRTFALISYPFAGFIGGVLSEYIDVNILFILSGLTLLLYTVTAYPQFQNNKFIQSEPQNNL